MDRDIIRKVVDRAKSIGLTNHDDGLIAFRRALASIG